MPLDADDTEEGEADERSDEEAAEDAAKALDAAEVYGDGITVISPADLADVIGVDIAEVRAACAALDVQRLGSMYAIDREDVGAIIDELAAAGVI